MGYLGPLKSQFMLGFEPEIAFALTDDLHLDVEGECIPVDSPKPLYNVQYL